MALTKHEKRLKAQRKRLREDDKLRMAAAKISASALGVVPVYVLLELYGWKRIRLTRFIKRYIKVMQDIYDKKISTDALNEEILHQTGLRYDKQQGMWFDTRAKERKEARR